MEIKTAIWTIKETKSIINSMNRSGFIIDIIKGGYKCDDFYGDLLFKAIKGKNVYNVTYTTNLYELKDKEDENQS